MIKETPFWSAFGLWFTFEPLLVRSTVPIVAPDDRKKSAGEQWRRYGSSEDSEDLSFVFIAHRRSESHRWSIPDDDGDLLNGVGACDSATPKNDDRFEMVLLMTMGEEHPD